MDWIEIAKTILEELLSKDCTENETLIKKA